MKEDTIRVGAVSYLNTKPLLHGIHRSPLSQRIELYESFPARIAQDLIDDRIDLGLIPVVIIPSLPHARIVTDYCIGCEGAVASVCLFSEVPMNRIREVILDYQSRTSAILTRILLRDHWKIEPQIVVANDDQYRERIKDTTAALVIGDRAFEQRKKSTYIYDLGEAWKEWTGLPFVFAAWVANKELPKDFIEAFNEANALGLAHLPEIVQELDYKLFDLYRYYKYLINYRLDERKREGLRVFLEMAQEFLVP